MNYLIDTNVFFDLLRQSGGEDTRPGEFGLQAARSGECFISYITQIEIISVIGKYARGGTNEWQQCKRQIELDDKTVGICTNLCRAEPPRKKWSTKRVQALKKLLQDILSEISPVFVVKVLPVNENVLQEASRFIEKSMKYRFGSLDSIIAGTAKSYVDLSLNVVSKDKGLRAALLDAGIPLYSSQIEEHINSQFSMDEVRNDSE